MGEMADEAVDYILFGQGECNLGNWNSNPNHHQRRKPTGRASDFGQEQGHGNQTKGKRSPEMNANREVAKRFTMIEGENGEYAVVLEQGMYKETVAVSFDRTRMRSRGFVKKTDSLYNRRNNNNYDDNEKEVVNMHQIFTNMASLLNNLYSADLIVEKTYNAVLDAHEPFIMEALEYEEIENYIEPSSISQNKKKRISQRGKTIKPKVK